MNLLKILNDSAEYLRAKEIESPRLQVELLMSHVLQIPRLNLYLQFDREMKEEELEKLRPLLKRRGQHEPIQHILGETNFCGLTLQCSPAALIPRPETELLVELVFNAMQDIGTGTVYDVGTGTGAIALALASKLEGWQLIATDISSDALDLAKKNHSQYPQFNIQWIQTSLLENQTAPAEAIVANLPYLTREEMTSLQPEVKFDPIGALDGGSDGLDLIRKLIPQAAKLTKRLFLEIGIAQAEEVELLCKQSLFSNVRIEKDLTGRSRFIVAIAS